jgi:hypothetical protein
MSKKKMKLYFPENQLRSMVWMETLLICEYKRTFWGHKGWVDIVEIYGIPNQETNKLLPTGERKYSEITFDVVYEKRYV